MPLPAGLKFWDPTVILGPAACRAKPWWWPKLLPRSVQRWCTSMWTWRSATQKWPTHFCSRTRDLFGIWTCFNYLHKNVDPQSLGFGRNPLSVPSPDMDCKLPFLFDLEVWTSNLSWWNPKRGRPNFLFSSRIPSNHWFWCCFRFSKKWPNKTPSDITWDTAPIAALPNIAPHWVLNRSAANPLFGRTGLWIIWTNPPNVKHAEPRLDHGVLHQPLNYPQPTTKLIRNLSASTNPRFHSPACFWWRAGYTSWTLVLSTSQREPPVSTHPLDNVIAGLRPSIYTTKVFA